MERLLTMRLITIKNIIIPTLLLGIFFIPFNSWSGIGFLGEYYRDSCFLFFLCFCSGTFQKKNQHPYKKFNFSVFNSLYTLVYFSNFV